MMGFFFRDKEPWSWHFGVPSWEPTGIECLAFYMKHKLYERDHRYATNALLTSIIDYSKWRWVKRWSRMHNRYKES